jgi:hypothetical protein
LQLSTRETARAREATGIDSPELEHHLAVPLLNYNEVVTLAMNKFSLALVTDSTIERERALPREANSPGSG